MPTPRFASFEEVTWTSGLAISEENADQIYTRYAMAARLAAGKRVLELGCGEGQGLGLVAKQARFLVGGDYAPVLLRRAREHYGSRVPLVRLSAESLPFADRSFDLVLFFEATYYIPDIERAFDEIVRVLSDGGRVVFANHNPERPDFVRSPHSTHYHSADEFRTALEGRGLRVEVEGAFPVGETSGAGAPSILRLFWRFARRAAMRLHLVPRTVKGRALIKRLMFGHVRPLPRELTDAFGTVAAPRPLPPGPVRAYQTIYVHAAVGRNTSARASAT